MHEGFALRLHSNCIVSENINRIELIFCPSFVGNKLAGHTVMSDVQYIYPHMRR